MTKSKETPMMQQYFSIKNQYPDTILFFRLGDFYEMFYDDALLASRILEITLTSRNKKADDPIPMCGVPFHSATDYIRRLVKEGYKVAICEQLEDPRSTKGMVKRDVVKVITPGTILVENAVSQKENNYLITLFNRQSTYYLAYCDLSTGESRITSTKDWTQCISEFQTIDPSEWVYDPEDYNGLDEQAFNELKSKTKAYPSAFHKSDENSPSVLKMESDQGVETEDQSKVLDYLSAYLYATAKQSLDHMQKVQAYELSQYLQMNPYTKSQLELTESLRTQKKKGSLLWLLDQTQTAMGGRLLHQWLDKPLLFKQPLMDRHLKVAALMDHYFARLDIQEHLKKVYDLERLVTKISMQSVNAREMTQLKRSLAALPAINKALESINQDIQQNGREPFVLLNDFTSLRILLDQALVDDPPISITEGGFIRTGYDEELDDYHQALEHGQEWLLELQERERQHTGLKTLKVGYNKVFGYYIEISRLQAGQLDDERYIRKQTLANSERFITEELKSMEERILQAQEKSVQLEYALFIDLREKINQYKEALQELARNLASLDVLAGFASLSESNHYVQAEISDCPKDVQLVESRHPVLEQLIGSESFVANDLSLTPDQFVLLLTGPNMSGKSTYMRQVAYAVIMNQIGCFVPAKKARLPLVDQIFTRIGSSDDLSAGQSTFMVEMIETNYALANATNRSLILFDEIGRGTATFDGIALAQAILYYICQKVEAMTIFSTHYHELVDLEDRLTAIVNIHVGAVEEHGNLVFLYKILKGPADKSYGIHVARLAGMPDELLDHSQEVLDELEEKAHHLWSKNAKNNEDSVIRRAQPAKKIKSTWLESSLEKLDLNQLTPLEALNRLAQWKNQLNQAKKEE